MATTYSSKSPYYLTPQNSWYLGHYSHRRITPDITDKYILVDKKYEERPDLLAYELYGSAEYWWVFIARNMDLMTDPIFDLKAGMYIYAPSISKITGSLS